MELVVHHLPVSVPSASPSPKQEALAATDNNIQASKHQHHQPAPTFNMLNHKQQHTQHLQSASFSPNSSAGINYQHHHHQLYHHNSTNHLHDTTTTNVNNHDQQQQQQQQWTFLEAPAVNASAFGGHSFHQMNSYLIPNTNFIHSPSAAANLVQSNEQILANGAHLNQHEHHHHDFSSFNRPSIAQSSLQNELTNGDNLLNSVDPIPDSSGSIVSSQPATNHDDQQSQPVFLSSYIPEMPVQQQQSQLQAQIQQQPQLYTSHAQLEPQYQQQQYVTHAQLHSQYQSGSMPHIQQMQQQQQYTTQLQPQHYQPGSLQQIQQQQHQQQQQQHQHQLQHEIVQQQQLTTSPQQQITANYYSPAPQDDDTQSISNKDCMRIKDAKIPISYDEIVNLSIEQFNDRLAKMDLTETEISLVRDIRRRGKNKVAAQNCRKRKLDQIMTLQEEVDDLVKTRVLLTNKRDALKREYDFKRLKYK